MKKATANLYLFGSQAKGTAKKDSDWDVVVVLNKSLRGRKSQDLPSIHYRIAKMIGWENVAEVDWLGRLDRPTNSKIWQAAANLAGCKIDNLDLFLQIKGLDHIVRLAWTDNGIFQDISLDIGKKIYLGSIDI